VAKPILYLDCCSLNRPLDNLSQPRVAIEAQAVEELIELVQRGSVELATSPILRAEVNACSVGERRQAVNTTLALANVELEARVDEDDESLNSLVAAGLKDVDALHLLTASTGASHFVTTDDGIIKRAVLIRERLGLSVLTPIEAATEVKRWLG
jgi:hypothetical protein